MYGEKGSRIAYLKQDLGLLCFLGCIFAVIVTAFVADTGTERTECLILFLILFVPGLFSVYKMQILANALAGIQVIAYTIYKIYQWSVYGIAITAVAYAWVFIPIATVGALWLFGQGMTQIELKNELLREQVEELVVIEPTTGLYNRRGLYTELNRQMSYARRNSTKLAVLELRLKYEQELRRILSQNQFAMLRQRMAELVENSLRMEDRLYAIDQEGTLVAVLNTDKAGAELVERRLKSVLSDEKAFANIVDRTLKVEIKAGAVEYDQRKWKALWNYSVRWKTNCSMTCKALLCLLAFLLAAGQSRVVKADSLPENTFIVMEEVYAFSSPVELLERLDTLLGENLPVVLGIMPIYENTEYPAMREFIEVIRYAQSEDCRILLHFPIVSSYGAEEGEITEVIEGQIAFYESMGIYPAGILMGEGDREYANMTEGLEKLLPVFRVEENGVEYYDRELMETFPLLETQRLPRIFYSYEANEIPEEFDFQRDLLSDISYSLESQNRVLMVVVGIGVAVFLAMIGYARWRNRKDFLKD